MKSISNLFVKFTSLGGPLWIESSGQIPPLLPLKSGPDYEDGFILPGFFRMLWGQEARSLEMFMSFTQRHVRIFQIGVKNYENILLPERPRRPILLFIL